MVALLHVAFVCAFSFRIGNHKHQTDKSGILRRTKAAVGSV